MKYKIKNSQQLIEAVKESIQFAFQPIVNAGTGGTYAVEALLRGHEACGFASIAGVFDCAWELRCLEQVDRELRKIAIESFAKLSFRDHIKLFYNLDGRIFEREDEDPNWSSEILARNDIQPSQLVFELSEHYNNSDASYFSEHLQSVRDRGIRVAIDDFGRGFSEMKLLYDHQAEYLKIDRFFVDGIAASNKKRLFVSSIVNLAHVLGLRVVAEGIEEEQDYLECRAIGCDLIQGYFISVPETNHANLKPAYEHIEAVLSTDRRRKANHVTDLSAWIEDVESVSVNADIKEVLEKFKRQSDHSILPLVDCHNVPVGILREQDFKAYLYDQFGWDLLHNKSIGNSMQRFCVSCPVTDVTVPVRSLLEIYSLAGEGGGVEGADGLIVTENGKYKGFLKSEALLRIFSSITLAEARDQNPLTGLPGNNVINDHIADLLLTGESSSIVYFDFNEFKPFNDAYGFRQGDRVIILFSELLRKRFGAQDDVFIGHVGGDDFFLGFRRRRAQAIKNEIQFIMDDFKAAIESFYQEEDRKRGKIVMEDRHGQVREFDLLNTAAAIVELDSETGESFDSLSRKIVEAKNQSKKRRGQVFLHEVNSPENKLEFTRA
ncbi:GGDEF domain-containing protein [Temperatibacter marinus]|uniref:GGDEF domain-containing protein n=1 Tax=Temperatibacter marinus TaxID=1456591 RepID=A0AA52EF70_9PROT|nr:GGDEF domain-containing protein [Temperatibacter marinus]WND01429.1 GGDEF domain-containing protein [Temperatibacter marinus]